MATHQGRIIKNAINKMGIPFSTVAKRMKISRNTLYKRFSQEDSIPNIFILKLGHIIQYDFSETLPTIYKKEKIDNIYEDEIFQVYRNKSLIALQKLKEEHAKIVKLHQKALLILLEIANRNKDKNLKEKIEQLVKESQA